MVPKPSRLTGFRLRSAAALALAGLLLTLPAAVLHAEMRDAAEPLGVDGAPPSPPALDRSAELQSRQKRNREELQALSRTITLSSDRQTALAAEIDGLQRNNADLRQALIDSATRRKDLERRIGEGERKLADLRSREDGIRSSLRARRGLLAEVLAALQRMGRNPPPALLVTPDDALSSVRSAILLGAVVPGMRRQTEALLADLGALQKLAEDRIREKEALAASMAGRLEEERRMDLLIASNDKASGRATADLAAERQKADALAARATSLEGLITALETEITGLRAIAEKAAIEEAKRQAMTEEQRRIAAERAGTLVPDKNRIAPAYAFSDLKGKLDLPVAGEILRRFGDPDGTGHAARGITVAANAGTVVTAPADAHVVFAGQFRSYGQMIILNAGDGFHLVLTGMDGIKASEGKFVFAGEPIAVMGEKRVASSAAFALETDRPTLYIEFRKDGKPVDSAPWWTAATSGKARNDS